MIADKYPYPQKGDRVRVYTASLDGEPATVECRNQYGNVVVKYDRSIPDDEGAYSGQIVHPKQVEPLGK
jgi:hypothetical protein